MGRAPCCEKMGLKKGPWSDDEDQILISYIQQHGHPNWRALPKRAGLLRCGKSCRLRWTNYLRPDIKRGNFSKEEEDTIIHLHEMLGNRSKNVKLIPLFGIIKEMKQRNGGSSRRMSMMMSRMSETQHNRISTMMSRHRLPFLSILKRNENTKKREKWKWEEKLIISPSKTITILWSVIASKLPGRTDNEIKNVWHTHLKKRLESHKTATSVCRKRHTKSKCVLEVLSQDELASSQFPFQPKYKSFIEKRAISNQPSCSESSSIIEATSDSSSVAKNEEIDHATVLDDSFWSETLSGHGDNIIEMNSLANMSSDEFPTTPLTLFENIAARNQNTCCNTDDMYLWYDVFTRVDELSELPEF